MECAWQAGLRSIGHCTGSIQHFLIKGRIVTPSCIFVALSPIPQREPSMGLRFMLAGKEWTSHLGEGTCPFIGFEEIVWEQSYRLGFWLPPEGFGHFFFFLRITRHMVLIFYLCVLSTFI